MLKTINNTLLQKAGKPQRRRRAGGRAAAGGGAGSASGSIKAGRADERNEGSAASGAAETAGDSAFIKDALTQVRFVQ